MKLITLYLSLLFFSVSVSAQNKIMLTGRVINDENVAVEGVNIIFKGKGLSSVTNADGKFVMQLPVDIYSQADSVEFSCIGYQSAVVSINAAIESKNLVLKLVRLVENLDEVVVKPATLKQLLDSIVSHNNSHLISPVKLEGYYRELVFSNAKCTEYSDALCSYYFDSNSKSDGQLKINASRCVKEKENNNNDSKNLEVYVDSKINPNVAFKYAMLSTLVDKYLPEKNLPGYDYRMDQLNEQELRVVIAPKTTDEYLRLTFILQNDYTIRSFRLEVPENMVDRVKGKSLMGIHSKTLKFSINVNYASVSGMVYPDYYAISKSIKIWGKFFGTSIDELITYKSEFLTAQANKLNDNRGFNKADIYKKGNICNNGVAMNDALLKNYTIITPTKKDSVFIKALSTNN